jgi:hypothetical protein
MVSTVYNAGHWIFITHHVYHSELMYLGARGVVLRMSQQHNPPTGLPTLLSVDKAEAADVIG